MMEEQKKIVHEGKDTKEKALTKPKKVDDTNKVEKKKTKYKKIEKEKMKLACEDCGETLNIGESRECETKWKLFLSQCLP